MLVLTRKRAETIQIGENIFVKVIRTGRSAVKIGIEAPANVRVVRGELMAEPAKESGRPLDTLFLPDHPEMVASCSDQFPHPHIA